MRSALALAIGLFALTACQAERTGPNSVEISTDTAATAEAARETSEATADVREGARDAAQSTETAVRDAAQATETALREGARQTGTALEKAGKEIQQHSKPGNQP